MYLSQASRIQKLLILFCRLPYISVLFLLFLHLHLCSPFSFMGSEDRELFSSTCSVTWCLFFSIRTIFSYLIINFGVAPNREPWVIDQILFIERYILLF